MTVDAEGFSLENENINLQRLLEKAGLQAAEREKTDNLHLLIMQELHHRIKNTLATVGAITSQSLRNARSLQEARDAIENRLAALSRVHDLLFKSNGGSAKLGTIISQAIEPFQAQGSGQFVIAPLGVDVRSDCILPLTMALNELSTNAIKYGALSVPEGRVDLGGRIVGDTAIVTWTESGGPTVAQPSRRGFGLRLIEISLTNNERGSAISFLPRGVVCELAVPLDL